MNETTLSKCAKFPFCMSGTTSSFRDGNMIGLQVEDQTNGIKTIHDVILKSQRSTFARSSPALLTGRWYMVHSEIYELSLG